MSKDKSDEKIWEEIEENKKKYPSYIPKRVNIKMPDGRILTDEDREENEEKGK